MDREQMQRMGFIGLSSVGAVLLAFVLGGIMLAATGHNPFDVYGQMFSYGFQTPQLLDMAKRAGPLIISGCAVAIGFKLNLFNIGVEGQYRVAMLAVAAVGGMWVFPWPLGILVLFVVAAVTGAAWAWIPAFLKVKRGVNEVISTIMLNAIAIGLTAWLFKYVRYERVDSSGRPILDTKTTPLPESSKIGSIASSGGISLSWYFVIALVIALLVWLLMFRSTFGFQLRASGLNPVAAKTSGIDSGKMVIRAMLLSGGVAGFVGLQAIMVEEGAFRPSLSLGLGFAGIAVALLGRNHPGGIIVAALLFGFLQAASGILQVQGVPRSIVDIIQGLVVLSVVIVNESVGRWLDKRTARSASKQLSKDGVAA